MIRDNKIQIVDEYTGRAMPDRSWERGLHQLIEMKEGCPITGHRETLARVTYQRFFRRYLHLCGMTGTATEVANELWAVYRLRVTRIDTHKPCLREVYPTRCVANEHEKWATVLDAVRAESVRKGRPILIGTRSVEASERVSAVLSEAGVQHQVLNARQDVEEAALIAKAGLARQVTVATNMAGRGTDIKLGPGVAERGGLHVVLTEWHEAKRIDRQLFGRAARQGDPGSCAAIVCLDDDIVQRYARPLLRVVQSLAKRRAVIALLRVLVQGTAHGGP